MHRFLPRVLCICLLLGYGICQLSAPVDRDDHISVDGNKYLKNLASLDQDDEPGVLHEEEQRGFCPLNVELKWLTEVSSSVYATPLITDLYSDGHKDVIVPSFVHYLEVLEGLDGAQSVGWPAYHQSHSHASPLLHDIDYDGVRDVVLATYDAEILFFKDTGEALPDTLTIPRLKVRRKWYEGLDPDPTDHTHPDVGDNTPEKTGNRPSHTLGKTYVGRASLRGTQNAGRKREEVKAAAAEGQHLIGQGVKKEGKAKDDGGMTEGDLTVEGVKEGGSQKEDGGGDGKQPIENIETKLRVFRESMVDFSKKFGEHNVKELLSRTKAVNPKFYLALMEQLKSEGIIEKDGIIHLNLPPSHTKPPPTSEQEQQKGQQEQQQGQQRGLADKQTGGTRRRLMAVVDSEDGSGRGMEGGRNGNKGEEGASAEGVAAGVEPNPKGSLSKEASSSFGVFKDAEDVDPEFTDEYDGRQGMYEDDYEGEEGEWGSIEDQRAAYIDRVTKGLDTSDLGAHDHTGDDSYDELEAMRDAHISRYWQDEDFRQKTHPYESEDVYIDPHVLCTPNIADIDGDGHDDIVVAVSYFFDRGYYDNPSHMQDLHQLDTSKYVASGVVAYDLRTRRLKWTQHLDLSTDTTTYRAYAYAPPTLADINKDGKLEVIMGTSMGFLYVLDYEGKPLEGWPLQMAEIQAQALVMDVNNDGEVEIVAADTHGNVACFSPNGDELWMRHVKSLVAQGPTAGDINGDGEIEILFGTTSGHVHALSGSTGLDVKNFPFRTHGRVQAPVLITRLVDGPQQHAIVMSFDGYLYLIDGISGCADSIDIGEASYSMVLADDLDGNGLMDLLVSTMNGNVYMFETPSEYHPLKAWPQQVMGPNGMLARHDLIGVYATASSRMPRDVAGNKLEVQITVIDKRAVYAPNGTWVGIKGGPYSISIVLKGVGVAEMNAGHQPVIGVADTVDKPGTYTLQVPCPRSRSTATLRIEMTDSHGLVLYDEFSLSFHLHFHKLLKWLVAGPLIAMTAVLLAMRGPRDDLEDDEDGGGRRLLKASLPVAVPSTSQA